MAAYVGRRLIQSIFVLFGAITILFVVVRLVPGDPATLMLGAMATEEQLQALREALGLNEPLAAQYGQYLLDVVRLDFGESFQLGGSALGHVLDRLPATLLLAAAAMLVALTISFAFGIAAAKNPRGLVDRLVSTSSLVGQALPQFWVGIMLILLFALFLGLLPSSGSGSWQHLILPSFTLALPFVGWLTRLIRGGLLEELGQDYVQAARAKGMSERTVFYVHVLRNALVPVVTVIGLLVGEFIGSAVIVEVVFAWPGVGRLLIDSITFRDYAVVQVAVVMITAVYVFSNLVVDVLYGYLDPRIRMEEQ